MKRKKHKSFWDIPPIEIPIHFILAQVIGALPTKDEIHGFTEQSDLFLQHQICFEEIFRTAERIGHPIELRGARHYIFYRGTDRIITNRYFEKFVELCLERMQWADPYADKI